MFDYIKNNFVQSNVCTPEAFDSLLDDATVINNCAGIRKIVESIPADASKEELRGYHEMVNQYKSGCHEKGIQQLPGWCFHATFKGGRRTNENATPSGLCSIDLDHVDQPLEFFQHLLPKALEQQLALAFITPSTSGLKMVFPLPEGAMSMEEAQDMLVSRLGVEAYFDHGTMDLARVAFAVPRDYILYRNDALLFSQQPVPEGFGNTPQLTAEEQELMVEREPMQKASEHFVDGIPMSDMLEYLSQKYCGRSEPGPSQRNTTLYQVAKVMRVACQDDFELLVRVMPVWGQSRTEWNSTLRSACKRPISQSAMQEFEEMLVALKREKAINDGLNVWKLPEPPHLLPPVFREYARISPPELRPAQLMALLPILGFYGTLAKANYADPDEKEDMRTPSFIVVVSAPPASGKSLITQTFRELTERVRLREIPLMQQLNNYNRSRKEEDKPSMPIRLMPEKLSMTSLSVQMENARGMHLLQFTPEIDTLKASNGSGAWNDLSTVFRKALDNDNFGQIYMSGESHCCNVPVYLNQLIEAQPETMKEFFNHKNVTNGLVSRVIVVQLPDNTGCRKTKVKRMSDFERENVQRTLDYLESIGVESEPATLDEEGNVVKAGLCERQLLKLPRSRKALKMWGILHQDNYLKSQENPAEDHFFRRAAMLGFHAAMVAYMCSGCKETKEVIDFALWVAEYTLQSQLQHFGNVYNSLHAKRIETQTDEVIRISEVSKFKLLDHLPEEFTVKDINLVCQQHGKMLKNPHQKIARWKAAEMVCEIPTGTTEKRWRKTADPSEAEVA